jgi:hypothetical protein
MQTGPKKKKKKKKKMEGKGSKEGNNRRYLK